jgi:hypothetical protein
MSRNQRMALGILGLAIVLIYGLLGAYALIYLTQPGSAEIRRGDAQAANVSASQDSPGSTSRISDTVSLPQQAPPPTNTRAIPEGGGEAPAPTATAASSIIDDGEPTSPAQPTATSAEVAPPALAQATPTLAPSPTPPPPAPSPTPDTSCVEDENAQHQQKLSEIEAEYAPMLIYFEDEMAQAERDRDQVRLEEIRMEYEMYQEMKAAALSDEKQRHEAALAACPS